jgi:hypothetical protein
VANPAPIASIVSVPTEYVPRLKPWMTMPPKGPAPSAFGAPSQVRIEPPALRAQLAPSGMPPDVRSKLDRGLPPPVLWELAWARVTTNAPPPPTMSA